MLRLPLLGCLLVGCGSGVVASPSAVCPEDSQTGCPAAALTYDTGIGALLEERCSPCHAPGGVEAASVLLTDYDHARNQRMGIGSQLVTCSMPPPDAPPLSNDERQQILDWLTCDTPR